jgi:hypothetical protein
MEIARRERRKEGKKERRKEGKVVYKVTITMEIYKGFL